MVDRAARHRCHGLAILAAIAGAAVLAIPLVGGTAWGAATVPGGDYECELWSDRVDPAVVSVSIPTIGAATGSGVVLPVEMTLADPPTQTQCWSPTLGPGEVSWSSGVKVITLNAQATIAGPGFSDSVVLWSSAAQLVGGDTQRGTWRVVFDFPASYRPHMQAWTVYIDVEDVAGNSTRSVEFPRVLTAPVMTVEQARQRYLELVKPGNDALDAAIAISRVYEGKFLTLGKLRPSVARNADARYAAGLDSLAEGLRDPAFPWPDVVVPAVGRMAAVDAAEARVRLRTSQDSYRWRKSDLEEMSQLADLYPTEIRAALGLPPRAAVTATASVSAVSGAGRLRVDVTPDVGKGYWTFKVQYQKKSGGWGTRNKTYRTKGTAEVSTVNLPKGTYRVVVKSRNGLQGSTSAELQLDR